MASEHDPLGLIGTTVEKYKILEVAGEGGFSTVYKAEHLIWKQPVAIKFFSVLEDAKPELRERMLSDFIQEGKLMTDLSSRSAAIVQARDIGKLDMPDGAWIPYMVLEWLDGESLDRVIKKETARGMPPRSLPDAVRLLEPAAIALDVAHQQKVAHRDLKPANIMIMGNPRTTGVPVKVLDFGIAKVMGEHVQLQEQLQLTGAQITAFTPNYGAPEQFSRSYGATGPWTDVYAMALIVIELLRGGTKALEGDTYFELGVASCDPSKRPTPRELGMSISPEVDAVFARALALQPADRYPNMGAFWRDLFRVAVPGASTWQPALSTTSSNPALPDATVVEPAIPSISVVRDPGTNPDSPTVAGMAGVVPAMPSRSKAPLVAAAALAVVGLVGGSMYLLSSSGARDPAAPLSSTNGALPEPDPSLWSGSHDPRALPTDTGPVEVDEPPTASVVGSASSAPERPQSSSRGPGPRPKPAPEPKPEPEPGKDAWDPSNFGGRR